MEPQSAPCPSGESVVARKSLISPCFVVRFGSAVKNRRASMRGRLSLIRVCGLWQPSLADDACLPTYNSLLSLWKLLGRRVCVIRKGGREGVGGRYDNVDPQNFCSPGWNSGTTFLLSSNIKAMLLAPFGITKHTMADVVFCYMLVNWWEASFTNQMPFAQQDWWSWICA